MMKPRRSPLTPPRRAGPKPACLPTSKFIPARPRRGGPLMFYSRGDAIIPHKGDARSGTPAFKRCLCLRCARFSPSRLTGQLSRPKVGHLGVGRCRVCWGSAEPSSAPPLYPQSLALRPPEAAQGRHPAPGPRLQPLCAPPGRSQSPNLRLGGEQAGVGQRQPRRAVQCGTALQCRRQKGGADRGHHWPCCPRHRTGPPFQARPAVAR